MSQGRAWRRRCRERAWWTHPFLEGGSPMKRWLQSQQQSRVIGRQTRSGWKREWTHRVRPSFELLEDRTMLSAAPYQHVLILSVDGLHQTDPGDPALKQFLPNILSLRAGGVVYANAYTTK